MERKVWRIPKAGNIDRLQMISEAMEEPVGVDVLVMVHAVGLNFADVFALQGLYSATPEGSFIPGLEFSGEVLQVGEKVSKWKVGDRVLGVTRFGAYASHVTVEESYLAALPDAWSFDEGAAFPVQALTAYYALVSLGNVQPGQVVLIQSAAGGVGIWANRIAKHFGAVTIGSVGSKSKFPVLQEEQYDHFLKRSDHFYEEVLKIGKQPDLVLECVGGKIFEDSYRLMAKQGRLVVYGAAHFGNTSARPNKVSALIKYLRRPKIDPMMMMRENKSVMGFNLIWMFEKKELYNQLVNEIMDMQLPGPRIGHTFPFSKMLDAVKTFQKGQTIGKVVVTVT